MLYTVAEVSKVTSLSKVSIYKRLKLKDLEQYIIKKQGITYIDEVGLKLIKDGLKVNIDGLEQEQDNSINADVEADKEPLNVKQDYIQTLKEQLKIKDQQIQELHNRLSQEQDNLKNMQVLQLKQPTNIKQLEEHFQDMDTKLINIREQMQEQKKDQDKEKNILKRIFKKK